MSSICDGCGAELPVPEDPTVTVVECRYCKRQHRVENRSAGHPAIDDGVRFDDGVNQRHGTAPCEFESGILDPLVIDGQGRIFAQDFGTVHVFDAGGKCLGSFDTRDSGNAYDLAVGPNDVLYAITGKGLVAKYSIHVP